MAITREAARVNEARYRARHKAVLQAKVTAYRESHRAYFEAWNKSHKDYFKAKNQAWYLANKEHCKEKNLDGHLKRKFGISLKEYQVMLAKQKGLCAICEKPPRGKHRLHVDHDHKTNRVRALLCHHCNAAIGYAKEDPKILYATIDYLRKWGN